MSSSKLSKKHHYGCIGHEEKQSKMMEVWQKGNKRIFNCYGGKESGKSCFIRKFLDDLIQNGASDSVVIDMDFRIERIGPKDSVKFWRNLAKKLQRLKEAIQISDPMMEESLESFFEELKGMEIIFLLDNLDYARNAKADDKSANTEKDLFSELQDNFIPGLVERTDLSMVFITSTVQLRYGHNAPTVHKIEMDPLSTESAGDLLLKTIELTSDMDNKAAREHLGQYLEPIALLSEGIPMAVIVTGSQLTESNFFIKPKEMLTVLIFSRMYTLSPELFPKEDNMIQTYGDYIEKQSSGMKERLQEISKTDSSSFTLDKLMQHLPAKDGKAFFKTQTVTPLLLRSFVKNVGNPDKSETLEMPGFLREFIIIEKIIDSSKGLDVEDRLACRKVVNDCLHRLGKDLEVDELRRIIENTNEYDEFVEQIVSSPTPEDDRFMDTQKDMGKNDLGKPFIGYSPESLLGCRQESNLSDLPEQRMQNLKLLEKGTDQDSHSSPNPDTPNEEIQGEQRQYYLVPGQLGEHLLRFNYNVSKMPESMGRSPQSIADAGFIYKGNNIFECQYCGKELHRSHLTGNVDIMQKHREIDPRCPFVHLDQKYPLTSSSQQVKDKGAMKERRGREGTQGGDCVEEIEREFLQLGVKENGEEANGVDAKNDKFDHSQNLSSSHGNKQYPDNKMDFSEKDESHHEGPKEADTDQDSHSSLNPGTPNEVIQGEQTQDFILSGQCAEQFSRFNYNASNMPPSMERLLQSIAHAGFMYKGKIKSMTTVLDGLQKKEIIFQHLNDLSRPSTGIKPSIEMFHTYLSTLSTKSCLIQQPPGGWTVYPAASDLDTVAYIRRLRYARNNLFHHEFSISDAKFQLECAYISAAVSKLFNHYDQQQQVKIQIITAARDRDSGREKEMYHLIFKDKIDEIHHLVQGTYDRGRDGVIAGAQAVIERQQDYKADVYTLPWSCYPRVEVLMQQHNSIYERSRKLMDRYNTFRQNLTPQSQFLPTRACILDMKRDPQILVIGDLRGEVTIRNIACSTDQLKDDLPFKTTTIWNWTRYYHSSEDPDVVVFTVRIVTEDDFSRCLNNLNHILGHPYHIICVIEMGHHINRQSEQYLHFDNVVARYIEQSWNREAKVHNFSVILDDQLMKEKVPGNISECFELEVVTSLILIEDSLKKNIRDEDFISHLKFAQAGFVKNIKDTVTSLLACDYRVADAVWDRFQNEVGSMTLQALKDIITEVYLQAIRKGMVNELSCFIGIMPEIMERLVDRADFEPLCKASIQDSTISNLVESFQPAMTGYSCEHLRNQEERKRFWKLIEKRDHSEYIDILIDDLIIVIEDTARKIILKELEKNLTIQKKLHFEVVSLLKRTVSKDRFEHLLSAGELPSDDLFGIEEVEGFGILYNKLHVHIKLKNPEDEGKIFEQIKVKLCNYHHPYRIVVIADSKASVCVGERLYTLYQNREKDLTY